MKAFPNNAGSKEHHDAKCLVANIDKTIQITICPNIVYGMYVDLNEWNNRSEQTFNHISDILQKAIEGNYPYEEEYIGHTNFEQVN